MVLSYYDAVIQSSGAPTCWEVSRTSDRGNVCYRSNIFLGGTYSRTFFSRRENNDENATLLHSTEMCCM